MKRDFAFTRREHRNEGSAAAQIEGYWRLAGPDRHLQVLRVAATQFAMTGLHGTTTPMLARATGISEEILYARFGSKESLFREAVEHNVRTRLRMLEARTLSAVYESEITAIQRVAEATVTGCAAGDGNSVLMNWALLEDHENASDLYRDEIGSVEILWNRVFAENFRGFALAEDSRRSPRPSCRQRLPRLRSLARYTWPRCEERRSACTGIRGGVSADSLSSVIGAIPRDVPREDRLTRPSGVTAWTYGPVTVNRYEEFSGGRLIHLPAPTQLFQETE